MELPKFRQQTLDLPKSIRESVLESVTESFERRQPDQYDLLLLSFQIDTSELDEPFRIPTRSEELNWCNPNLDWTPSLTAHQLPNSKEITRILNCQIRNNNILSEQLYVQCASSETIKTLKSFEFPDQSDAPVKVVHDYYQSDEQKKDRCRTFVSRRIGYMDSLSRDQDVMTLSKQWEVPTYALVLLSSDSNKKLKYQGHIYMWLSPQNNRYEERICFAQGIRNRIDSAFLENPIRGFSRYIFQGISMFARDHLCTSIVVPNPLPTMKQILLRLGAVRKSVSKSRMGLSLAYPDRSFFSDPICSNCFSISLPPPDADLEEILERSLIAESDAPYSYRYMELD